VNYLNSEVVAPFCSDMFLEIILRIFHSVWLPTFAYFEITFRLQ
jgi:hypothetical protein